MTDARPWTPAVAGGQEGRLQSTTISPTHLSAQKEGGGSRDSQKYPFLPNEWKLKPGSTSLDSCASN